MSIEKKNDLGLLKIDHVLATLDPASDAAKILSWTSQQLFDVTTRVLELEEEAEAERAEFAQAATALKMISEAAELMQSVAHLALRDRKTHTLLARDFAPWINIMAWYGVEPYAKKKRTRASASDVV